jgi:hypothetical protein
MIKLKDLLVESAVEEGWKGATAAALLGAAAMTHQGQEFLKHLKDKLPSISNSDSSGYRDYDQITQDNKIKDKEASSGGKEDLWKDIEGMSNKQANISKSDMPQFVKNVMNSKTFFKENGSKSNTIPKFEEVWQEMIRSDGFRNLKDFYVNDQEMTEEDAILLIQEEQKERYEDVVYQYEELEGKDCWRKITIEEKAKPDQFKNLGIFWATEEHAADAHWGKSNYKFNVKFRGKIELKNVDWPGTIYSRLEISLGDEEKEIRFIEGSKIFVYEAKITGRIGVDQPRVIPINNYRLV